jgi:tetratricopeptide (TPR) repeat protein
MQLTTKTLTELKNGSSKLIDAIGANATEQAALLLMGHRFFEQGKLNEARKIFSGLAVLDGSNPYVYGMLGAIFQKEQRYELAVSCYNKSLELFPEDINSLVNRGETLLKLGNFMAAARDLKDSIELDKEQEHPAANRARLLVMLVQDAITLAEEQGISAVQQEQKKSSSEKRS